MPSRYRRQGHNELDQARFTQPVMYEKISKHPTALSLYKTKLVSEGSLTQKEVDDIQVRPWLQVALCRHFRFKTQLIERLRPAGNCVEGHVGRVRGVQDVCAGG